MAAADPLCRELTAAERMWLPQTSLVAVTLQITAAVAEVTSIEKLKEALEVSRAKQPFLCVCIDAEDVRFQRVTGPVPLTSETLETSAMEDVRAATRKRLQEGLDRHESFGRAHLVKTPNATFLSVYGDHLCFDAKSFVIWATTTLAALAGDPLGELTALDFVDWTTRIPSRTFEPLVYPFDSLMLKTLAPNPDEDAGSVTSFVETIPRDLFIALKARTKELGSRLNAPLMVAFFAAIADVARHQQPDLPAPLNIRSVCAVDLRTYVEPPLPIDYMNNSAAVVPASASFPNVVPGEGGITGDLWPIAKAANQGVVDAIANGEGFRLNDITKRGECVTCANVVRVGLTSEQAFAEMGPYFAIPCLWSNVGHIATPHAEAAETMISGAATNPVVTGHCTEAGNVLALTITYAPNLHEESAMRLVAQRFRHHVTSLATTPS